tara:strand:+ start:8475 stop:8771 length:297 start_codon:yes stop_codon:yes gene_type:complete
MNIQKIAAYILLVVLIITMIIVYAMLYHSNSELTYPPLINKCPDKMKATSTGCSGAQGDNAGAPSYEGGAVCEFIKNSLDGNKRKFNNWDGISNAVCD